MLTQKTKIILANLIGTMFELYELSIYGFLAPILAENFFPTLDRRTALINTFGIFMVGFLIRPIGATLFGHIGDTQGRKNALVITISIMSLATFAIGLLPTFHQIGLLAPILLAVCRSFQGFSFSGEFIGSLIFLFEFSDEKSKGFIASWATCGGNLGSLLGSCICLLCIHFLTHQQLIAWGWRIPFLLAIIGGAVALYLRLYLLEKFSFEKLKQKIPLVYALQTQKNKLLTTFLLSCFYMIISYLLFVFSVSYFTTFKNISMFTALSINALAILSYVITIPLIAKLSDTVGRKFILLLGIFLLSISIYPYYFLLQSTNLFVIGIAHVGISLIAAIFSSVLPVSIAELFPPQIRFTATGLSYNFAGLLIGGTTPLMATLLMQKTQGIIWLCSYFLMFAGMAAFVLVRLNKEKIPLALKLANATTNTK